MANDITPVTGSTTSSSITATKLSLHLSDKRRVQAVFDQLDRSKLWYLKATIQLSQADNSEVLSVEEKILNFALKCNYIHSCHSFILDLNDENWREVFTKEELQEIHSDGPSTIRHIDRRMEAELDRLEGKVTIREIYNHSGAIEHDLEKEPHIGWLSTSVTSLSSLFFNEVNNIDNYMESDRMYRLWFFLNTIFDNSPINAIGKEKSSVSNSMARNSKRKISAVEEMPNRRIGRKVDTVYSNGIFEFGALEIGNKYNQTKEMKDGGFKLPHVMKDMLLTIVQKNPTMLNKAHVVGYIINGKPIEEYYLLYITNTH
ncbi:hypothetical protein BDB01DRAFT_732166 [Pilobolus umbonatus]|nr:hypothetical protein BDB01DRAFT_732166 [Pilobolus umbonatus]